MGGGVLDRARLPARAPARAAAPTRAIVFGDLPPGPTTPAVRARGGGAAAPGLGRRATFDTSIMILSQAGPKPKTKTAAAAQRRGGCFFLRDSQGTSVSIPMPRFRSHHSKYRRGAQSS